MGMQGHFGSSFRADTLAPPAGFAGHPPTRWGGVRTGRRVPADTLGPPRRLARPPPPRWGGVRTGRRLGELVLRRWVRLGKGSARLSLGRGTQPAGSWATICCVPGAVITPNVVAVKTFRCLAV